MRRREFILTVAGAAAWPLAARAQQPALPAIGFLNSSSPASFARSLAAFRQGLKETGFVEGQNVAIEFRWAEGRYERLPDFAADLVKRGIAVLVATGGIVTALAAKAATTTIPIVFSSGADPVEIGLIAGLSRPGSNLTGVSLLTGRLIGKRLEILHEVVPKASAIGVLINPNLPNVQIQLDDAQKAGRAIGQQLHILYAGSERDFESAFAAAVQARLGALMVGPDAFFSSRREQIVALAARERIPTIYEWREFTEAGGLMSYGSDRAAGYQQVGVYAGRILKGSNPADLPVVQLTKVEFVLNLRTARALGLTIPLPLLGRADEVIE
jgi:putative ABC transport system substrate-binding protein